VVIAFVSAQWIAAIIAGLGDDVDYLAAIEQRSPDVVEPGTYRACRIAVEHGESRRS
jgi:hypothetical protein